MKKICVVVQNWKSGGIESFLHNVLLKMDLSLFEIHLIAESLDSSIFTEDLKNAGITFIELSGNARKFNRNVQLFRKLLKQNLYDVLHVNAFQSMSLYYGKVAFEEGVPIRIAHSHNTALRDSWTKQIKLAVHNRYKKQFTNCFSDLWACSHMAAKFLFDEKELARKGYRFVPNGIQIDRFLPKEEDRAEIRKQLHIGDSLLIGNVGRLCRQKNQSFLVELMPDILLQRPDAKLLLVGEGPDKKTLIEVAKKLDVSDSVIFYGATSQVEKIYSAIDVLAFPSIFEGLPIVTVEAQAAGLPVICSELMPEETYITSQVRCVSLSNKDAWVETLISPNLKRINCQSFLRNAGFSIEDVAAQIEDSYLGHFYGQ